ncbi:MAG TPA: hypothetical protein VN962_10960 [Polyangia bacterium]|nr:hypothetical protein [Polyangia bacterium]
MNRSLTTSGWLARLPLLVLCTLAALAGCHSKGSARTPDSGTTAVCSGDAGTPAVNGRACGCDADCASGFCVDGVCCNSACTESCKACNTLSAPGTCSFVAAGDPPRSASICPKSDVTSCGLDGTCDGKGGCRSYVSGTVCQPGTCNGASLGGIRVCDGAGSCTPGPATICAPFNCDTRSSACLTSCTSDSDCAANVKCVNGSCGRRPVGAACSEASQCASGFCADGFCCNVACTGSCVSCDQSGRMGTCWPTAAGVADPHKVCTFTDKATCGQTGACDGLGGCAHYAAETVCAAPSCSGERLTTAATCDGLGTCRPPGVQTCAPFACANSACVSHCTSDRDCSAGHTCTNGSCGLKSMGQPCSAAAECTSGFCGDGVCCATACAGSCRSCALSTSLGTCAPVPAGAGDPHGGCFDQGAASCGTDGTCDGAGACHKYPTGTECAPETCSKGVYTPPSTCGATGTCRAPDAITCAPYVCNGARCYTACGNDSACATGNACVQGSCGTKPNGAFCSTGTECQSQHCAQGVCCASACTGSCVSCAISGSMGSCTPVPTGLPDPLALCADQGPTSCGTDGKCQAGACQKYPSGTACSNASCPVPGATFTGAGTCDGAGTCWVPAAASCFPFTCGLNACKSSCTSDQDCAGGQYCNQGSCGQKTNGAVCQTGPECQSGICAQGVCCATACTGSCLSCAVSGKAGTCTPVAAGGADPSGQCLNQGAASCGMTGFCNGGGACAVYAAGTQCAPPACADPTTTTLARTCDGAGACKPAATQSCAPYVCSSTTKSCLAACGSDADCVAPATCNAGSCGVKRLGQSCSAGGQCASGFCVDGVCCSAAACGTCQACNVGGAAGSCQPVAAGSAEPHQLCPASPPCGFDGTCNGAGACRNVSAGTSCGAATCTGSTTTVSTCNGAGLCTQAAQTCPGHFICGGSGCLTTCLADGDCVAGTTCQSGSCTNLAPLGTACTTNAECFSGMCTDHVCCQSASCGACNACNLAGKAGTCAPLPSGTSCGAAACKPGKTGTLNAASTCDAAGHCVAGAAIDCSPQACVNAACTIGCASNSDCAPGYACKSAVTVLDAGLLSRCQ